MTSKSNLRPFLTEKLEKIDFFWQVKKMGAITTQIEIEISWKNPNAIGFVWIRMEERGTLATPAFLYRRRWVESKREEEEEEEEEEEGVCTDHAQLYWSPQLCHFDISI